MVDSLLNKTEHRGWWASPASYGLVVVVLVQALALLRSGSTWSPNGIVLRSRHHGNQCQAYLDASGGVEESFSLILTADPGDFSGTSEAHYILANLKHKQAKPRGSTVCGSVFSGSLLGQPVVVATTGIGPSAAALCALEVLDACGPSITEAVYFGTSGWSPALGGILNPPHCSAAHATDKITRLGDVCVSPFSVNWTCKKASWAMQAHGYPNQCFRPEEVPISNSDALFGECTFYKDNMDGNLKLADAMLRSARKANMPKRSVGVTRNEQKYWALMSEATNTSYTVPEPSTPPSFRDYTQCMEVDGQMFYSGVPWELKARDYAAQTLTAALGRPSTESESIPASAKGEEPTAGNQPELDKPKRRHAWDAQDVIAVSAMEGIGIAEAFSKYNALYSTRVPIPYTHVRTASNWIHQPVYQKHPGVWDTYTEVTEDFATGYGYAIATGSSFIMAFFQERCENDVVNGALPDDFSCHFSISYEHTSLKQ